MRSPPTWKHMLCVWELVMIPDTMLARMLLLGCWQKCQMQQQPSKAVKMGSLESPSIGPLGSLLQTKKVSGSRSV
jgi:hypothetical protein